VISLSSVQSREKLLEPWFSITINNKKVPESMLKYVESVAIEDEEDNLPLATIPIQDIDRKWMNDKGIVRGAKIRINLGHRYNNRLMFDGQITGVDADLPDLGFPVMTIQAIDIGIKLQKQRKARNFKKQKVSDVVKKMLKECGLTGDVQDTKIVLDHIPQGDESNLEFITRWRKKLGWKFYRLDGSLTSKKYYFGEKRKTKGKVKKLDYKKGGMQIISFQPTYQDFETEDEYEVSEADNKGGTSSYKVATTRKGVKYPGLKDETRPVGKA
jgi:hypothetical protein